MISSASPFQAASLMPRSVRFGTGEAHSGIPATTDRVDSRQPEQNPQPPAQDFIALTIRPQQAAGPSETPKQSAGERSEASERCEEVRIQIEPDEINPDEIEAGAAESQNESLDNGADDGAASSLQRAHSRQFVARNDRKTIDSLVTALLLGGTLVFTAGSIALTSCITRSGKCKPEDYVSNSLNIAAGMAGIYEAFVLKRRRKLAKQAAEKLHGA